MASLSQIRAQVGNIVRRVPDAQVIGIRTVNGWKGNTQISVSERDYRVVHCASELQIREALLEAVTTATRVVVVTNLEESALGQDVVARLARRRLHSIEGWTILKDIFQARHVDPILVRRPWLADFLLELLPTQGVDPVPTGLLDAETVWGLILRESLGFESARPDSLDLLQWTRDAGRVNRFATLSVDVRTAVREWIGQSAGEMASAVLDAAEAGLGADVFPVGLALSTVFAEFTAPELQAAAARLERYVGGNPIRGDVARSWADVARALFDKLELADVDQQVMAIADRSDQILKEVRADGFAWLSDYSRLGFDLRLEQFGHVLSAALSTRLQGTISDLLIAAEAVQRHKWSRWFQARALNVEMALRLIQWLKADGAAPDFNPSSLEDAALAYASEGGFVDWARQTLYNSDPSEQVSKAYNELSEAATARRQAENRRFAHFFAGWMEAGCNSTKTVLIENVLKAVVAPAAEAMPILLVVVDGMSFPVYRELIGDIRATGWIEVNRKGSAPLIPAIAAFPSITEVCRRTLLTGKLMSGTGDEEKQGFAAHPDLLQVSKSGMPPVLFQKSDLTEAGGAALAADVRKEIASPKRRVVAAIVNAVDDHLLKGEQVAVPWTLRHIPILNHLLAAAMESGRLVIMTSDHGHVLDRKTVYRPCTAGERYRLDDGIVAEDEVRIRGTRVVIPSDGTVIAPWSEKIRYGSKRNGYHGGASPQECVIPLSILSWPALLPEGYEVVSPAFPDWWTLGETTRHTPEVLVRPPVIVAEPRYSVRGQAELPFISSTGRNWIDKLLESPVFLRQLKQAGRTAPPAERMRSVLWALDQRGGTILRQALAQKLGESELRIPGLLATVRRILNVDGYPVLSVDDVSGSIVLNRQLLEIQFELNPAESTND